jgi:hypothetical protein
MPVATPPGLHIETPEQSGISDQAVTDAPTPLQ